MDCKQELLDLIDIYETKIFIENNATADEIEDYFKCVNQFNELVKLD